MVLFATYVQANTIRGNRYLDDAGKLMNEWDDDFPQKEVGLEGLKMTNPEAKLRAVHVTTDRIWIQLAEPDTLTYAVDHALRIVKRVADIIAVTSLSRIALRSQYVYPQPSTAASPATIAPRFLHPRVMEAIGRMGVTVDEGFEMAVGTGHGEMSINIRISHVKRRGTVPDESTLPSRATMFDLDMYREGTFSIQDFHRFLREAERWTRDALPTFEAAFIREE